MGTKDRAAAAMSRMEQLRREMAERRALRHRNGAAIREQSRDTFRKHGSAMAKALADMRETARRRQAAGGWGTATIDSGPSHVMGLGLGPQDDEPATEQPAAERPAPAAPERTHPPAERSRRRRHHVFDDEEDFSNQSWMTNR